MAANTGVEPVHVLPCLRFPCGPITVLAICQNNEFCEPLGILSYPSKSRL